MLRLRMNQGRITKEKLKFIIDQCQEHGIVRTHCTTCQTVQLHDVRPEALTPIMKEALKRDIVTRGGGGDIRVMSCVLYYPDWIQKKLLMSILMRR